MTGSDKPREYVVHYIRQFAPVLAVIAATTVAPNALASPVGATSPSVETITLTFDRPGGVPAGWSASGVFSDSGSNPGWTEDKFICGACPSPVAFAGTFYRTVTSDATGNTINLRYLRSFSTGDETNLCFIEGGTGGYQNLHGQGTFTFVRRGPTSPFDWVCTAELHTS